MSVATFVVVLLGAIIAAGGAFGYVLSTSRTKQLQTSVDLFSAANGELRAQCVDLERRREEDNRRSADALHAQELSCTASIAKLEGQVEALTSGLVEKVGRRIGVAVVNAVTEAIASTK